MSKWIAIRNPEYSSIREYGERNELIRTIANNINHDDAHQIVKEHNEYETMRGAKYRMLSKTISGEKNHYAKCNWCGWYGPESDLSIDPEGHICGKDQCPECGKEGFINCCLKENDMSKWKVTDQSEFGTYCIEDSNGVTIADVNTLKDAERIVKEHNGKEENGYKAFLNLTQEKI